MRLHLCTRPRRGVDVRNGAPWPCSVNRFPLSPLAWARYSELLRAEGQAELAEDARRQAHDLGTCAGVCARQDAHACVAWALARLPVPANTCLCLPMPAYARQYLPMPVFSRQCKPCSARWRAGYEQWGFSGQH